MRARCGRRAKLSRSEEFKRVFKQAASSSDHCFTVFARPNRLAYPRLGLAISRKASPGAVGRNRIKRVIRESFRLELARLGGVDVVVVGRPGVVKQNNAALFASLRGHWARLIERYGQTGDSPAARLPMAGESPARS